jgi:hypothetical protein
MGNNHKGNRGNFRPTIEKDIQIPRVRRGQFLEDKLPTSRFHGNHAPGLRVTYPFDAMEVGDSFFIPNGGKAAMYVAASKYRLDPAGDNAGKFFALRQWHDGENYGHRMWRTS